jgi:hypothetical protein
MFLYGSSEQMKDEKFLLREDLWHQLQLVSHRPWYYHHDHTGKKNIGKYEGTRLNT